MSKIGSFYFISFTVDLILIQYSDPRYPSFFFLFVFGQKACILTANLPVFYFLFRALNFTIEAVRFKHIVTSTI